MTRRRYYVTHEGREHAVDVTGDASLGFEVQSEQAEPLPVTVLHTSATTLSVLVGGRALSLFRTAKGDFVVAGERLRASMGPNKTARRDSKAPESGGVLRAPMPGRVLKLLVSEGDSVSAGQAVLVIEAMKMENELTVTRPGNVKRVAVRAGDTVERDAPLLELE